MRTLMKMSSTSSPNTENGCLRLSPPSPTSTPQTPNPSSRTSREGTRRFRPYVRRVISSLPSPYFLCWVSEIIMLRESKILKGNKLKKKRLTMKKTTFPTFLSSQRIRSLNLSLFMTLLLTRIPDSQL